MIEYSAHENELAHCLELLERRPRALESTLCCVSPEIADLVVLARRIREVPPLVPDPDWLTSSKQRLLHRFDRQRSTSA